MKYGSTRNWIAFLSIFAVYCIAGKLGLKLAFIHASATPVWAPTGIALAAFLILGVQMWPAIFVGAFLVNFLTLGTFLSSLGIAMGNTAEGLLGAYLVNRYAGGPSVFDRFHDIFRFAVLAGLISTIVSPTIGLTTLSLLGLADWKNFGPIWLTWWMGNATGNLIVAPLFVLWWNKFDVDWNRKKIIELLGAAVFLCFICLGLFGVIAPISTHDFPAGLLAIPLVIYMGFRFSQRETATATFLVSAIMIYATLHGLGPFVKNTPNESLLSLQLFMGVTSTMGLVIASIVSERTFVEKSLKMAHDELENRVEERTSELSKMVNKLRLENFHRATAEEALLVSELKFRDLVYSNIIGFMMVNWDGQVIEANDEFLRMLGYTREDLESGKVGGEQITPPEYHWVDEWMRSQLETSKVCPPVEKAYLRKDGTRVPVLTGVVLLEKPEKRCVCFVIDDTPRYQAMQALLTAHKELEHRVQDRTAELSLANDELKKEITQRKKAESKLRRLSLLDPLTGLYNRRGFLALAEQHLLLAQREKKDFLLFFVDVDHLKPINDQLGHQRGDQALVETAEVLRKSFRKSDIVSRVGGDEFAIVATEANPDLIGTYSARMRMQLEQTNKTKNLPFKLSFSLGVTSFDSNRAASIKDLMIQADKDLYVQKQNRPPFQLLSAVGPSPSSLSEN